MHISTPRAGGQPSGQRHATAERDPDPYHEHTDPDTEAAGEEIKAAAD